MLEPIGNILKLLAALWERIPRQWAVAFSIGFSVAILFRVIAPVVERRLASPAPASAFTPVVAQVFDAVLIFVMLIPVAIAVAYLACLIYELLRWS